MQSLRFVRDRANKPECLALLRDKLKLSDATAARTYPQLVDPGFGFTPDAKFDPLGFHNLLDLRAEIERKASAEAPDPAKYVDLAYSEGAMRSLDR